MIFAYPQSTTFAPPASSFVALHRFSGVQDYELARNKNPMRNLRRKAGEVARRIFAAQQDGQPANKPR